ncbi:hypothetical protein ACMD2_12035, partial [Ananas comosus]
MAYLGYEICQHGEQVAMFLFILYKNYASNYTVQERFQHSGEIVSRHFRVVLEAITQLTEDLIQRPLAITPSSIKWNSKFYLYFENCIGAIDGTHCHDPMPILK